jgi:hypothetical protein
MSDTGKTSSKTARAEALEKALRDNLRRRKAAGRETPQPGAPDLHEKASGNSEPGA